MPVGEQPQDSALMRAALDVAARATAIGEVPIGCVIVKDGVLVARGHNLRESKQDPAAQAALGKAVTNN